LLAVAKAGTTEDMARRTKTPEVSTIKRPSTVAYARKQKPASGDDGDDDPPDDKAASETTKIPAQDKADDKAEFAPERPTMTIDPGTLRDLAEGTPRKASETTAMPMGGFGAPPEMPAQAAAIVIKGGAVEDPTHMPGPREIPPGAPEDVASPPGHVPPGDSRSLRRRGDQYEFALVYRQGNAVISRFGVVGTRGVWRVVEYPTSSSASNAYAREASRFVTDGFSDYRE
jgi:hypothetical protein